MIRTNTMGLTFELTSVSPDETKAVLVFNKKELILPINIEILSQCWFNWQMRGMRIQEAFRALSSEYREFLLTGITPTEWDELFKETEDE